MEDNRDSDRSEEELRCIIRDDIHRSRANWGENLYVRTQAKNRQASSALASFVNVHSGISLSLASSTSPSTNLTVLLRPSGSLTTSNLAPYHFLLTKTTDNVSQCTHTDSSQQIRR